MIYSTTDLFVLYNPYFNVLMIEKGYCEIQSRNTGHYWKIADGEQKYYLNMFHKYPGNENYHYQTCFGTIEDALLYIALHDNYIIYGKQHELYTRGTKTFYDYILEQYKKRKSADNVD